MVYDADNRLTSYSKSGVTTSYSYDGDGRRIKKVDTAATTIYVYNVEGQMIAEYTSGSSTSVGTNYLTTDHLGSTRVVRSRSKLRELPRPYEIKAIWIWRGNCLTGEIESILRLNY